VRHALDGLVAASPSGRTGDVGAHALLQTIQRLCDEEQSQELGGGVVLARSEEFDVGLRRLISLFLNPEEPREVDDIPALPTVNLTLFTEAVWAGRMAKNTEDTARIEHFPSGPAGPGPVTPATPRPGSSGRGNGPREQRILEQSATR
jgi:hypothetical protein